MRILHIIDTLSMGGAENVLVGLSSGQKERGHDVTIMPLVCGGQSIVRRKIENNGISVIPFMEKGVVYNPFLIFKIARVLKQFDLVHVHLFPALYWAALAKIISSCKVPLVYTEHSTNNRRRSKKLLRLIDNFIYKHGYKEIVACSEIVFKNYCNTFPGIKHVCVINNGVDTEVYREAKPYSKKELLGIDADSFVVTMVARFMSMKRQDTLVEAQAMLPPDVHIVFVGGEDSDEGLIRVRKMAIELCVSDRTHFLYLRDDVPRILKTSDVVVMASDYEGLSLSSIEGMAAGKPFVASDVDGLREVVSGAGVLFENGNSKALAEVIKRLRYDSEFYYSTLRRCLNRSREFDINTMVDGYLRVYESFI